MRTELSPDRKFLTIHVPMTFQKRGGRKLLIAPIEGTEWVPPKLNNDQELIRGLVLGYKWRKMLETGQISSETVLAKKEKISRPSVGRRVDMTLLAPDIIEAILDGKQPRGFSMNSFRGDIPLLWEKQRKKFGFPEQ